MAGPSKCTHASSLRTDTHPPYNGYKYPLQRSLPSKIVLPFTLCSFSFVGHSFRPPKPILTPKTKEEFTVGGQSVLVVLLLSSSSSEPTGEKTLLLSYPDLTTPQPPNILPTEGLLSLYTPNTLYCTECLQGITLLTSIAQKQASIQASAKPQDVAYDGGCGGHRCSSPPDLGRCKCQTKPKPMLILIPIQPTTATPRSLLAALDSRVD